ncbi:hypothetical protein Aple_011600 [Acrocarpospora pleiomorpha]|uniref:Uncharacterized protein n=1 Tax=Acrocarpospora pleiomorpha TaxID=90975 RepID=A0A5M3X963_9ACTN|nr:hypothetical protein [Acrocarpospora pleiomorpha]GES18265.1 hypothetical protein Aple_011600 [Acrocarpospora pleiomorpha]
MTTNGWHRIAVRAAIAGIALLAALIAIPTWAFGATTKVLYSCVADGPTFPMSITLDGSPANPVEDDEVVVTWKLVPADPEQGQASESLMIPPTPIQSGDTVLIEGQLSISGTPVTANPGATTLDASVVAQTSVATTTAMSPIPDLVLRLTPSATGTIGVVADSFKLNLVPSGAQSTSALYTCSKVATAAAASLLLTVVSASTSDTDDPTTTSTVFETETETVSVTDTATVTNSVDVTNTSTVSVTNTAQVRMTPVGGAQTGGGGDMGPDGRLIMLAGTAFIAAAAFGGLLLRHRLSRSSGV